MRIKSFWIAFSLLVLFRFSAFSGEGMWIPMLLEKLNEAEMIEMGMNITAEDIYSINHSSMKDAIVLFGRGCTAELISGEGLLLTNHHCGYSRIQYHSSVENDYLTDGFWAMSREEELPNPGLTVTLMIGMEEVSRKVLEGVTDELSTEERNLKIRSNARKVIQEFEKDSEYQATIKPFFKGNAYYLIITQTFKDIRLVGAPPSNIGKFGGDTDNWMWPRHTGDFSLFRIYVGPDGKPAEYSEQNVPYKPKYFFPISLKGVEADDFTFVFGYPARTNEYLPSYAIEMITEKQNPEKIQLRKTRLDIFNKYTHIDPKVRIQYASKHARVSNYWKKMIGESRGVERMNGIERKQVFEREFTDWVNSSGNAVGKYSELLPAMQKTYEKMTPLNIAYDYYREAGLAIELVSFAGKFKKLVELSQEDNPDTAEVNQQIRRLEKASQAFFKDYYQPIDAEVMAALLKMYNENVDLTPKPEFLSELNTAYNGDYKAYTADVFDESVFDNPDEVNDLLSGYKTKKYKKIIKDPAYSMYADLVDLFETEIKPDLGMLRSQADSLQRIYMKAQMEMQPEKRFYPDANFTLRVTYGKVKGYQPSDAVRYRYYTTLSGIMEKEDPNIYDYVVEDRLKTLYKNRDYGRYAATDGTMRVAFVATNHTTGGNSGSPVLNADGHLVGINFDRCWEGTMSDLMYDPEVCRNISLDVRYLLFIVDKFAGAGYLLEEMSIVD